MIVRIRQEHISTVSTIEGGKQREIEGARSILTGDFEKKEVSDWLKTWLTADVIPGGVV